MNKFTNYTDATQWLFSQLAMFQRVGAEAYKPGLDTALALAKTFGNPHKTYPTIHIAGTNGKGSTAHTIAAILQSAGYRTGLYTSPHLIDFRERMRVDGKMISQQEVVDFVNRYNSAGLGLSPSFFELTMIMAFEFFKRNTVDVAVIETGLGGRLDSTNIINPVVSIITNISFDHTAFLGDTLEKIAAEKAGIIKPSTPVVIGEATGNVRKVFETAALAVNAPAVFACESDEITSIDTDNDIPTYTTRTFGTITGQLSGKWQHRNAATILESVKILRRKGFDIPDSAVRDGFAHVCSLTGLAGRWMTIAQKPLTVCDTGHNVGGWQYLAPRIASMPGKKHIIVGFVNDKDIAGILALMAQITAAVFYFTQASVTRALPPEAVAHAAAEAGIHGKTYPNVTAAYKAALTEAGEGDTIFIGGSTFIVADFLTEISAQQ